MATGAGSCDHDASQFLQPGIFPRELIERIVGGVTLGSLDSAQHGGRLLEDLFHHVVLESSHQSSSAADCAFFFSQSHNAAEPAMPASAPYFALTMGISLA